MSEAFCQGDDKVLRALYDGPPFLLNSYPLDAEARAALKSLHERSALPEGITNSESNKKAAPKDDLSA